MKIQVIQTEHKGIPQSPELIISEDRAFNIFEDAVMQQGFRSKWADEKVQRYLERYIEWDKIKHESDTVRWWELDVPHLLNSKVLAKVDWSMLTGQRADMSMAIFKSQDKAIQKSLDGVLNFLDDLHDENEELTEISGQ